jgi:hypothetical protein
MSAEIIEYSGGVLTSRVSGLLKFEEMAAIQKRAGELIREHGPISLLTVLEDFQGLAKVGDWGDISYQMEFDDHLRKIAVVGDLKWKETAEVFTGKGVRRVAIEFFPPEKLADAKAWVAA